MGLGQCMGGATTRLGLRLAVEMWNWGGEHGPRAAGGRQEARWG